MPFCKRTILPKDVCKADGRTLLEARPQRQAEIFGDLVDVCCFTLCSVLRQLSDLSRHSVSILQELEGELVSICHRSGALEGRVVRLQRHVAELVSKPPPRSKGTLITYFGVILHSLQLQEQSWMRGIKTAISSSKCWFSGEISGLVLCFFSVHESVRGHHCAEHWASPEWFWFCWREGFIMRMFVVSWQRDEVVG